MAALQTTRRSVLAGAAGIAAVAAPLAAAAAQPQLSDREASLRYLAWLDQERTTLAHELKTLSVHEGQTWIWTPSDRFVNGWSFEKERSGQDIAERARSVLWFAGVSLEREDRWSL